MSRIDKIFCTTSFDSLFPLARARALPRLGSDHTPLLWDSGCVQIPKKGSFKFEKWWSTKPDFRDLVSKAWALDKRARNAVDVWQNKLRYFRRPAKGLDAEIRRNKKALMEEYDNLDVKAEDQNLCDEERSR